MKAWRALLGLIAMTTVGCSQSAAPVAPTSPSAFAAGDATAIGPVTPLKIAVPRPVSPADGVRLDTRQPVLVVDNPTAQHVTSANLRLRFVVENEAGDTLHESGLVSLGTGQTSYTVPTELDYDRTFRWFAQVAWSDTSGPASALRSFTTPEPPPPPAPPVDTCPGSTPIEIVVCQRGKAPGFMEYDEMLTFLRAVAINLNSNGIEGGPFGILHKTAGHNCSGYSCDIICAGQGGGQRQWDVLLDIEGAQAPLWSGPFDGGDIRSDFCEIP